MAYLKPALLKAKDLLRRNGSPAVPAANIEKKKETARAVAARRAKRALARASGKTYEKTSDHLEIWGNDVEWGFSLGPKGKPSLTFDPLRVNPPSERIEDEANGDEAEKTKKGKKNFLKKFNPWKALKRALGIKPAARDPSPPPAAQDQSPPPAAQDYSLPPAVRDYLLPRQIHQLRCCQQFVQTLEASVCGTNCVCFSSFAAANELREGPFACPWCLELEVERRNEKRGELQAWTNAVGPDEVPHLTQEIDRLDTVLDEQKALEVAELTTKNGGRPCVKAFELGHFFGPNGSYARRPYSVPESSNVDAPAIIATDPLGNQTVKFSDPSSQQIQAVDEYAADQSTPQDFD